MNGSPFRHEEKPASDYPDDDPEADLEEQGNGAPEPNGAHKGNGAAPPPPRLAPTIKITTAVHEMAEEAIEALRADPDLYQRSGALVHVLPVTEDEHEQAPPWRRIAVGTPTIRRLPRSQLVSKLSRFALWKKPDARSKKLVNARPDQQAVDDVKDRGVYRGIRALDIVVENPTMRPDASMITKPGYDPATRCLYLPSEPFPMIKEYPTRDDARASWGRLWEAYSDFPHKDEHHRAAAIAVPITAIVRPAILGGVPAFIFDANVRGAGKGLQASMASIIATGRELCTTQFPNDNPDHLRKTLFALAREGPAFISFDNLPYDVAFAGAALEDALTTTAIRDRILQTSDTEIALFLSLVLATGNNVTIGGDMPRRCIFIRLESPEQNPERRTETTYRHPERAGSDRMKAWCHAHRAQLVVDALTIVRAHALANLSDQEIARNVGIMESFGNWVRVVASAIVWAGGGNPLLTRPGSDGEADPETGTLAAIFERLPALDPSARGLSAKAMISTLYTEDVLKGRVTENHDGNDGLRQAIEALAPARPGYPPDSHALGIQLGGNKDRVVAGRKLARKYVSGVWRYYVVDAATGRPITAQ